MTRTRTGILAVWAMVLPLGPLSAQQTASLTPGQRVRVTASAMGLSRLTGRLTEVRGDTLLVRTAGGLLGLILPRTRIPMHLIDTLEVSLNHGDHVAAGIIGGLVGGIAGIVLVPCGSSWFCLFDKFAGFAGGELVGLLAGGALVPERWGTLSPNSVRVGLMPLPAGRLGLGASLTF